MSRAWTSVFALLLAAPLRAAERTFEAPPPAIAPVVAPGPVAPELPGDFRLDVPPAPAPAAAASEFILSAANLQVADRPADVMAAMDELRAIKDPEERSRAMLARAKIDKSELMMAFGGARMTRDQIDAFAARLPGLLETHLSETLARHEHEKIEKDGVATYRVRDGLAFWADFLTPADPDKRLAARVFVQGMTRKNLSKDRAYRLAAALTESPAAVTRVVDSARLSSDESNALERLAKENGLSVERFGRYLIAGSGAGFELTKDVLVGAQGVHDPVLAKRLDRVLKSLSRSGIDVVNDENVGAAAFYNPMQDRLAYVMPSRAGLNAFSHEATHARFHRFEKQLKSWSQTRKLAIPYEADGPFVGLFADFGGFMNLLNELNSWRTGESFDGGKTDEAILEILRDSYGRQAGPAAAALFASLWPATRTAGVSVPRLILRAARALNRTADADLLALAAKADEPSQMNFLRLLHARFGDKPALPEELTAAARGLADHGATDGVREVAKRVLAARSAAQESPDAARLRDQREYARAANAWLETFKSDAIKVLPSALQFGSVTTFRFAAESGLFDYDEVSRRLIERWGSGFSKSDEERALFDKVKAEPGATWDEKLKSYLVEYNATGFDALWDAFEHAPTFNVRQLLVEQHKADFKPAHVRRLALWALRPDTNPELQSASAELLSDLMESIGFSAIYAPDQLKMLQDMQRSMNEKAGRPLDAFMPKGRSPEPGHWLFAAIDQALADAMFDGKPGVFRLKMIEVVTQRTYPEELPRLSARLIQVITDPNIDRYDQWVARMFLIPSANQIFTTHVAWGDEVAESVLGAAAANPTALEFVGEFYRLGLGPTFRGPAWGKYTGNMDAARRGEAVEAIGKLSPEARARYDRALDELWRLLGESDLKVRTSALYAVAFRPVFFVGLEARLADALEGPPSPRRDAAVRLAAMARPGFSPVLDAALSSASLTERDKLLLRGRPR